MVGKSFISSSGLRLSARAARPGVSTAEVRRKLRRFMPASGGAGFGFGLGAGDGMSVVWSGFNGGGGHRSQWVRAGRGWPRRKMGRMGIVTVHARLAFGSAQGGVPKAADAAVRAGF